MGLLADGSVMLADEQAECDGETITYTRPGVHASVEMLAVIGGPAGMSVDASLNMPARTESRQVDFVIRIEDFEAVMPANVVPRKGDRITRTMRGKSYKYSVFADDSAPAFDFGDPDQVTYRIHARFSEAV